jgi:hypothetical protein
MAARKISAIDIKELYYGDVIATVTTPATGLTGAEIFAHSWTKVDNIHDTTFKYEEASPTVNKYRNQLTGKIYRSEKQEDGEVQISFVIGQYDYTLKAALQGGTGADKQWARGDDGTLVYKAIKAITEDGVAIIFPRALIVATGSNTDRAIGLSVVAIPEESGVEGIVTELWIDATEIKAAD